MTDEAWGFEWGTADGNGGFVRLSLHREERVAWYWAYLWRPGLGPVVVRDHEVALPRGRALEIRADSLWSELVCETPGEHWSIGLEAFAVALDTPEDALTGEIGERVAFGLDLEWETAGEPFTSEVDGVTWRDQPGRVRGEVLLGSDRIAVDTPGAFEHSVGVRESGEQNRTSIAWPDGGWWCWRRDRRREPVVAWEGGIPVALTSAEAHYDFRASATIPVAGRPRSRALGRATSGARNGTTWMDVYSPARERIG